jgi:hypothetical protein
VRLRRLEWRRRESNPRKISSPREGIVAWASARECRLIVELVTTYDLKLVQGSPRGVGSTLEAFSDLSHHLVRRHSQPEEDGIPTPLQGILDVADAHCGRSPVLSFGLFRVAFRSFEDDHHGAFIALGT